MYNLSSFLRDYENMKFFHFSFFFLVQKSFL